jgi:hypothetical protein
MSFEFANYTGLIKPDEIGIPWKGTLNVLENDASKWLTHENVPADIKKLGNKRILLIDNSAISRSTNAQKTFPKMPASLELKRVLPEQEVSYWISKIMETNNT